MLRIPFVPAGVALFIALGSLGITSVEGQALPPCFEREHFRDPPWVDGRRYCLEEVIHDPQAGELGFTALASAPDGTLYAARPLAGEVLALTDSDADGLPDSPQVAAEGLTLPHALAYHEDGLYIAGGPHLYRLSGAERITLADDLPVNPGGWVGDLVVGPDERLYLSIGAGCNDCEPARPEYGSILSMALDGTDRQIVATGLRQGAGLAFLNGVLWATDSAPYGLAEQSERDELNRVTPDAFFGWPGCAAALNCQSARLPELTFPTGSTPLGLAAYQGDVLPDLDNTLLVVLNGSRHRPDLRGYGLAAVHFNEAGQPARYEILIPAEIDSPVKEGYTLEEMNYRGSGFWPHRLIDVTVSSQGWIYVSVGGGQIVALRPL